MDAEEVIARARGGEPVLALRTVGVLHRLADRVETAAVAAARAHGWSWEQIGDALGVAKQSAHAKHSGLPLDAQGNDRVQAPAQFAAGARDVIVGAVAEARLRGDRRIDTDHLLLGVLRHPGSAAAQAFSVDLDAARAAAAALDEEALALLGLGLRVRPRTEPPPCPVPRPAPDAAPFGDERPHPTPAQIARLRAALSSGCRAVLGQALAGRTRPATAELIAEALLDREPPDPAALLLDRLGADRPAVRARLAAAGAR